MFPEASDAPDPPAARLMPAMALEARSGDAAALGLPLSSACATFTDAIAAAAAAAPAAAAATAERIGAARALGDGP